MSSKAFDAQDNGPAAALPPGAGAEEALSRKLGAIPGLDVGLGLAHLRGRMESYTRVLRKFAETRAAEVDATNGHLAAGNHAELAGLMHNLKGVAGFLGAVGLQEKAAALCAAVRDGGDAAEVERLARDIVDMESRLSADVLAVLGQPPEKSSA